MLMTKRKPATVGEILVEEFMRPLGLTQGALAEAMGVQRKHVNELCNDRRNVTAATALIRLLHLFELRFLHQVMRVLGAGRVHRNDVGALQQLVITDRLHAALLPPAENS